METRRSTGRSSALLRKLDPSNEQGHPFTNPLLTALRTQEGTSISHSIPYQLTAGDKTFTRHVSAPENDYAGGGIPVQRFNLGD